MRNVRRYILAALCLGYLTAFLVVPITAAIQYGFVEDGRPTLHWLERFFSDLPAREGLVRALAVAAATTAGVFLLAVPLAVLTNHYEFRGRAVASALLMVPMVLPPFVGAIAIQRLLAREYGSINLLLHAVGLPKVDWLGSGFAGVVILEVLHLYPILYLNASAALANVDPTMIEAARNLGASRWATFRRVTLPLIRPGLFAGGTIVFIWSFCELGTPLVLSYDVLPVQIFHALNEQTPGPKTFAMVFVLLSAAVGLYFMGRFLFGRQAGGASSGRGVAAVKTKAGPWATCVVWLALGFVTFLAVLPHVGVVLLAVADKWADTVLPESYTLKYLHDVFTREDTWNSIANSLQYASLATVVDIALGLAIAYLVVRAKIRGGGLLDSLTMLPLAVPGLVIASGYVLITTTPPDIPGLREFLLSISPRNDPVPLLIIAYSVRRLPYVVRSISAGLEQTPVVLEEAARNLGAGQARTVLRITVPLILANILAGALLAFSFAMLEVSDSLILAQTSQYYPITKTIWSLHSALATSDNLAAAMGVFGMLLLTATLLAANLLLGKRLGALFRV